MNTTLEARQKGIRKTVTIAVVMASLFVVALAYTLLNPPLMDKEELKYHGTYIFDKGRILQPFSLVDDTNAVFDVARLEGKWGVVFFGFTHCPDVCPTTLATLNNFYTELSEKGWDTDTQIIMVSADPQRDTPEILNSYVRYFNPNFIGVTGDYFDVHRFATQLNTMFRKVPGGGENYQVDHGANLAIINPYGHFHGFMKPPFDAAKLINNFGSVRRLYEDLH